MKDMETLQENIDRKHEGSPKLYADDKGYAKQQVNEMLRHGGYWMHKNRLFIMRRDFNSKKGQINNE